MSFSFPIRIEWGYVSYDLRERLNGIQEVSGSIPLISTRRIMKGLISSEIKPFCFLKNEYRVLSRFMRKIVCRLRLSEVNRQ